MARTINMTGQLPSLDRADLTLEQNQIYVLELDTWKVSTTLAALPAAGDSTSLGLVVGAHETAAHSLQGTDFGGLTKTETCRRKYTLPVEYVSGQPIEIQVHGGVLTTISSTSATVLAEVVKVTPRTLTSDSGIGTDLVTTTAQSINSLTMAYVEFNVTPTGLVAGDQLDIEITAEGIDGTDAGVMKMFIDRIAVKLDVKG